MDAQVVTKSEFATLTKVTPGRVSQWISEGKLGAAELEGEGRSAKIRVPAALAALKLRLDGGQRLGNGLETNLGPVAPVKPAELPVNDIDQRYKQAKLEQQEAVNRKIREEELARAGIYMLAEDAKSEMAKLAGQMLQSVEGGLVDMAQGLAAQYQLPQRDVVHFMRAQFRDVRAKIAAGMNRDAQDAAPTLEHSTA